MTYANAKIESKTTPKFIGDLIVVMSFSIISFVSAEQKDTQKSKESECVLTFGWTHYPPYQISNGDKPPTGIHIDLIKSIAAEASCKLA